MKRSIFILCLSLVLFNCKGQRQNKKEKSKTVKHAVIRTVKQIQKMDTIYKQQHDKQLLTFVRNEDSTKVEWKTIFTNNNGNQITIHKDFIEKNIAWKFQSERNESPIDLYNIAGSFVDAQDLYVVYNRFGQVFIAKYNLTDPEKFTKEEEILQQEMASGSFGNFVNEAQFRKINSALFFSLYTGQSFTGTKVYIYKLQSSLKNIKQLAFRTEITKYKTVCVSESGKLGFTQNGKAIAAYDQLNAKEKEASASIAPTKQERVDYELLKKYIDKPFAFVKISNEEEKYKVEEAALENAGLTSYNLFLDETKRKIDSKKFKHAEKYINEVLTSDQTKSTVKILDYIYDNGQENTIYFFCDDGLRLKIIRYKNDEWLISNYDELPIQINKAQN
jgi:hypothetical protein